MIGSKFYLFVSLLFQQCRSQLASDSETSGPVIDVLRHGQDFYDFKGQFEEDCANLPDFSKTFRKDWSEHNEQKKICHKQNHSNKMTCRTADTTHLFSRRWQNCLTYISQQSEPVNDQYRKLVDKRKLHGVFGIHQNLKYFDEFLKDGLKWSAAYTVDQLKDDHTRPFLYYKKLKLLSFFSKGQHKLNDSITTEVQNIDNFCKNTYPYSQLNVELGRIYNYESESSIGNEFTAAIDECKKGDTPFPSHSGCLLGASYVDKDINLNEPLNLEYDKLKWYTRKKGLKYLYESKAFKSRSDMSPQLVFPWENFDKIWTYGPGDFVTKEKYLPNRVKVVLKPGSTSVTTSKPTISMTDQYHITFSGYALCEIRICRDDRYWDGNIGQCLRKCTCQNGIGKKNQSCGIDKFQCWKCDSNYFLKSETEIGQLSSGCCPSSDHQWIRINPIHINTPIFKCIIPCSCENGKPPVDGCPNLGEMKCSSCNEGFELDDSTNFCKSICLKNFYNQAAYVNSKLELTYVSPSSSNTHGEHLRIEHLLANRVYKHVIFKRADVKSFKIYLPEDFQTIEAGFIHKSKFEYDHKSNAWLNKRFFFITNFRKIIIENHPKGVDFEPFFDQILKFHRFSSFLRAFGSKFIISPPEVPSCSSLFCTTMRRSLVP